MRLSLIRADYARQPKFQKFSNAMKVLLRNKLNGWFYRGPSKWTPRQEEALDLGHAAWALEMAFAAHLENVEIVLCYEDSRYNLVLPVERTKKKEQTPGMEEEAQPGSQTEEQPRGQTDKKPGL